jgi:hypothetical protein
MERETGIEPAPSAWKAEVLPLNYSRPARNSSTEPYQRYGIAITIRFSSLAMVTLGGSTGGGRWITPGILPFALRAAPPRRRVQKSHPEIFVEPSYCFGGSNPPHRLRSKLPPVGYRAASNWWREVDSNHRRRKPADLQSAPVGRLGIPPTKNGYCVDRGVMCQHLGGSKRPIFLDFPTILTCLFSRFRRRAYRPIAPCSWRAQADAALSLADDVRCHRAASMMAPAWACRRVYRARQTP